MQKIKYLLKAVVVISVVLAFILPSSAIITNIGTSTQKMEKNYITDYVPALNIALPKQQALSRGADILVSSDNPDEDDSYPKMAVNNDDVIVLTYQKSVDVLTQLSDIVYSNDNGASWTIQFEINSGDPDFEGSGVLESNAITYAPDIDEFFWCAIDPGDATYPVFTGRIIGDIANAENMPMYDYSWTDATDYVDVTNTYVGQWQVTLNMDTSHGFIAAPALNFEYYNWDEEMWYTPNELNSEWAMGMYYDGQSVLETAPASKPEMATGDNRLFMVMETFDEDLGYSKISYKATYNDLDPESETFLFTLEGGPSGMDKYADVEVWPFQMFIAEDATDPDVSAKYSKVAVVYVQNGDVMCKASNDDGQTWTESTVEYGANYPCVFVSSNKIYVAYVKNQNIYLVESTDLGNNWNSLGQINDESGTVVDEPDSVGIGPLGVVWTDERNDADDIYFEYIDLDLNNAPSAPQIIGPSKGGYGASIEYKFSSVDADGDNIAEFILDWGDGNTDTIVGPFASGAEAAASHTWAEEGNYIIKAKAKDQYGLIGPESTKNIEIPRARYTFGINLQRFLNNFPNAFPMLRVLLGL